MYPRDRRILFINELKDTLYLLCWDREKLVICGGYSVLGYLFIEVQLYEVSITVS